VTAAVEAALADDDVPFELMSAIPHVALKVVGGFRGVQDLRFDRLNAKAEAYQLGGDTWACARGRWHGRTTLWVCWKPELGLGLPVAGRDVVLSFTVSATIVMQLDGSGDRRSRGYGPGPHRRRRRVTGCGATRRFPGRERVLAPHAGSTASSARACGYAMSFSSQRTGLHRRHADRRRANLSAFSP
jgi:hypothetical protein